MRPYRGRIALAGLFLVLAAVSTLVVPVALKQLVDEGLVAADPGERVLALRGHFLALFGVGVALGVFSALRFYMVSPGWANASPPTCATPSTRTWFARAPSSSRPRRPVRCSRA